MQIQPEKAIDLAKPLLKEHGTYVYREDKELKLHVVKHKNWYYIMQTNYPAKSVRYYMQPAVKVHINTGKIEFSKRK